MATSTCHPRDCTNTAIGHSVIQPAPAGKPGRRKSEAISRACSPPEEELDMFRAESSAHGPDLSFVAPRQFRLESEELQTALFQLPAMDQIAKVLWRMRLGLL